MAVMPLCTAVPGKPACVVGGQRALQTATLQPPALRPSALKPSAVGTTASQPSARPWKPIGGGSAGLRGARLCLAGAAAVFAARRRRRFLRAESAGNAVSSSEPEAAPEERTLIVGLVAAAYVIWQMDKVNMSVAVLPMAAQFGWDAGDEGLIQSSIFWGYASTQVLGGFLSTRYGGKRVLLFAVALWSLATALAPIAASSSTEVFVASRVLVGIGEGLAPASGLRMVATWIPEAERSRAVATLGAGKTTGSIVGLLLAPVVITAFGWQAMFYSFGILGLGWALAWAFLGKDRDEPEAREEQPIPWKRILSTPQLWAVVAAHFCHDWGGYALLTWTPTYLNQALGYNLQGSSSLTVIPSLLAVAVAAGAGVAADKLHGDGLDLTTVRKAFQGLGFFLPCAMLGCLGSLGDVDQGSPLPIILLTVGIASGACSYAGLYASHADLNAKYSGLVNGISTTFGALAGVCSNAYAGMVLKAGGGWAQAIFLPSVALYVLGFLAYTALYDASPIDWDAPEGGQDPGAGRKEEPAPALQAQAA